MRIFGYLCYITTNLPRKGKFDARAFPCLFLGYLFGQNGYKVSNLLSHATQVSKDVVFEEDVFSFKELYSTKYMDVPMRV